ncbi:hypothetical protein LTR62_004337 [Meristemomyces frigidus]|uniref:Adenylyl cyclase-associated protein n=1 Tax=Meristemomyces frigidus TaxID=1508187 RepID=A0AAN7TI33_9PEZI|nr:hypothetical protein LTR62_004337 [Meristemomyces frigidus]
MATSTPHHPIHPPIKIDTSTNPLTKLIHRLEAATSRLEDIASSATAGSYESSNGAAASAVAAAGATPLSHPSSSSNGPVAASIGSKEVHQAAVAAPAEQLPVVVTAMDELMDTHGKAFVEASKGIDPAVEEQASAVAQTFADQRKFLLVSTKAKKPDMQSPETFNVLLKDLQQHLGHVSDIRDSHRASPFKEHLAMVGEGVSALQWLIMDGKPADFVGETIGGAQMYGNRVLKEKDPVHVKFVRSYYALLTALQAYVKEHYPRGLTWNANGPDAIQTYHELGVAQKPTTNGAASASSGAPPPPPPLPNFDNVPAPPPPPPTSTSKSAALAGGDMGAVFDQLNRGESVTSGLKKVDKSQMTHKNPSLRSAAIVPGSDPRSKSPGPGVKPKPQSMRQNSTITTPAKKALVPKQTLDGNKWLIENHSSPGEPITLDVELTQSILITNCTNTTIILRGKANAISIDNSPRLQLLVENLISSIDVIKSSSVAVQITGKVPTILLDSVDGAQIYLSSGGVEGTEVLCSKCSGVNVVLPPAAVEEGGEEDGREVPVPEQIRTVVRGGKLVSEIVEYAG